MPLAPALEPPPGELRAVAAAAEALARRTTAQPGPPQGEALERGRGDELRPRVASLLRQLAQRVEPALLGALQTAAQAWDQADALSVLDRELELDIATTRQSLSDASAPGVSAARRAVALEGLLVVDASVALVRLFERRLAALLRLRLRSATPELLPAGRPFLDLGRALREAAEAWR